MRITICGAGQVGTTLIQQLSNDHEITIIDTDAEKLKKLSDRFDINGLLGSAASPSVLKQASCHEAEMLVAVTSSDEVNMLACQLAHSIFHIHTKIARVRNEDYNNYKHLFKNDAIPIDLIINPGSLVMNHIRVMTQYPSALQVMDFANGRAKLVSVRAIADGLLVRHKLRELRQHIPHVHARIAAIYRHNTPIELHGSTQIEPGDEVFFIAEHHDIRQVMRELRYLDDKNKCIFIAGGGVIGMGLAAQLEKHHQVKVFECNLANCRTLSRVLNRSVVIHTDVTDQAALVDEGIEECDIFCAITNVDEVNMLSCLMAKYLGARKALALLNNAFYEEIIARSALDIDQTVTPQQITTSHLLSYIRRGDVVRVHSLRNGMAEALEAVVHDNNARMIGHTFAQIALPYGASIGTVIRGRHMITDYESLTVQKGDHLILFVTDKRSIPELETLFQGK